MTCKNTHFQLILQHFLSNFAPENILIMSQNQQNGQNLKKAVAAPQPCRRRKAAGWQAFPNRKEVLTVL